MTSSRAMVRAAVVAALALFGAASACSQSLVLAQTIDLPNVTGRIDHLDIDLEGNRWFVAALAAGSLEVLDPHLSTLFVAVSAHAGAAAQIRAYTIK